MDEMFKKGQERFYVRGDVVETEKNVQYIVSGSVGLYSIENDRRNFIFAYKAGEFFPYMTQKEGLFSGRKLEYRALSSTTTLSVKRVDFEKIAFQPQNIKKFVGNLVGIMEMQIERIDNLEQSHVYKRLLERLHFFVKRHGVAHGDKIIISAQMSHADIATSIGTSRETVNRFMRKLENKGVLTVKKQTIIINSPSGLQALIKERGSGNKYRFLSTLTAAILVAQAAISLPDILS